MNSTKGLGIMTEEESGLHEGSGETSRLGREATRELERDFLQGHVAIGHG